ncbi:hypothetical protein [Achromobacter phage tuull]|nr:hypothetical protein [Achromobacter phage tuull]
MFTLQLQAEYCRNKCQIEHKRHCDTQAHNPAFGS